MKKALLTTLRDINTNREGFRTAAEKLSHLLAGETGNYLENIPVKVKTPLAITDGEKVAHDIIIIPILRAGLAMLPAFLRFYPEARVGFYGMRRDETTKEPHLYYQNIPKVTPDHQVIIIDPMIATGGSGILAIENICRLGVPQNRIIYVGILAAPEGVKRVRDKFPDIQMVIAQIDERLNDDSFILPGIGDFGDRFFGTD